MKEMKHHLLYRLIILLGMFGAACNIYAREALITDVKQLSVNHENPNVNDSYVNLIDPDVNKHYYSGEAYGWTEPAHLKVSLNSPLSGADDSEDKDKNLVIMVKRPNYSGWTREHPTAFEVKGILDDNTEVTVCYVYLLYRGMGTSEYSSRISLSKLWENPKLNGKTINGFKFIVTANNGRKYNPEKGYREMCMSYFQIYKMDKGENYSDILKDRLHLQSDYLYDYKDYKFINTQGIYDDTNKIEEWNLPVDTANLPNNIKFPDYNFIEPSTSKYPLAADQKRQPTHTVEHILYAVPGDVIALYPYYELPGSGNYQENFSHWYDYKTGGRLQYTTPWSGITYDLLDFLVDPSDIQVSDTYGFYGSFYDINQHYRVSSVEDYLKVVGKINSGLSKCYLEIIQDLDFKDYKGKVPMIGNNWGARFQGTINGNGHKISGLKIEEDLEGVGLVGYSDNGAAIVNLVIGSDCSFIGKKSVGLVGFHADGELTIRNVKTEAHCVATITDYEQKAGGLLGTTSGNSGRIWIDDCYVGGTIGKEGQGSKNNAAIAAWIGADNIGKDDENRSHIRNTIVTATVYGCENDRYIYRSNGNIIVNKSYSNENRGQGFIQNDLTSLPDGFVGWTDSSTPPNNYVVNTPGVAKVNRKVGTFATFFCPRSPYENEGTQHKLPFEEGENEYVIAADFSQEFDPAKHLDNEGKQINEPIIAFRHIFRIRDGKEFADRFSGSVENNREYVRQNQRIVSARAGVPFQIRFDSPVPIEGQTRSKYYYKISDQDYRRVCSMNIRVLDADTRKEANGIIFYAGDSFQGQGLRTIDGVEYKLCAGTDSYNRMLKCDNPKQGRYIVQLIGKDINGNPIKIVGSSEDLIVMEYLITFLPESGASMITEEKLYGEEKYRHAREEELEAAYGKPKDSVNFDEYIALQDLSNNADYLKVVDGKIYYKWPLPWDKSTYAFGYDDRHDYNMYMIANHSSLTPYKSAAEKYNGNLERDGQGLYDRLYYKTKRQNPDNPENVKKGYFYYVNAATDPGVMSRLSIKELCPGSTIHVSAWIAEFTDGQPETANVAFNFVAILKEDIKDNGNVILKAGDKVTLHSFVTGYVPKSDGNNSPKDPDNSDDLRGEWLNVYYSFVPRLSEFSSQGISPEKIDHYELELDNNCKSSEGADYAIDNIRMYVISPVIYASQQTPVCDDEKKTTVKVESPFDALLQSMNEKEADDKTDATLLTLYYTFLDKEKYDASYDGNNYAEAFNASVLEYNYRGEAEKSKYGKLTFSTKFNENKEYSADEAELGTEASREISEDGERMIVFNTQPTVENLSVGKEYYIIMKSATPEEEEVPIDDVATFFQKETDCAMVATFTVKPTHIVKIDGVVVEDYDNLTVCENQSPVVQVNVWGKNQTTGEFEEVEKNAYFDWFDGSASEFEEYKEDEVSLEEALAIFREYYPEENDLKGINFDAGKPKLTEQMIALLKEVTRQREGKETPLLTMHQSSYVFPPVKLSEGQTGATCKILAVPIVKEKDGVLVCKAPTEIQLKVKNQAPVLRHGFMEINSYPATLTDVPLRIGLKQLYKVSGDEKNHLTVPVRSVSSTSEDVTSLVLKNDKGIITLVQTDDPEYQDLGTVGEKNEETGALLEIGEIDKLVANIGAQGSSFDAGFYGTFKFKEGYYYRMRFVFEESKATVTDDEGDDANQDETPEPVVCDGQDVFTIKVVPEYQKWIGAEGVNWNNDANWRRVSSGELLVEGDRKNKLGEYITDGSNLNAKSYAPLDFTKVIIPAGANYPQLAERKHDRVAAGSLTVDNGKESKGYGWIQDSPLAVVGDLAVEDIVATENIQYDMAAVTYSDDNNVYCRPWYANAAEQVHFNTNAEILNQQYLDYQKAWVDMEMTPGRWYTAAMPLQRTFAGDMYAPTAGARQNTELFTEIRFDNERKLNDRFAPAVYQRGWDKGDEKVYELPSTSNSETRPVAIAANWSHVYNDVAVKYEPGSGFSVKSDVSRVYGDVANNLVKFRFPKADESYLYQEDGKIPDGAENGNLINRENLSHRLISFNGSSEYTVTLNKANSGKFFLVGNPFMSHLDMAKFFEVNTGIAKKYWIMSGDSQLAAIMDENSNGFVGKSDESGNVDFGTIPPMQGFFVEANSESRELTLKFTPEMMKVEAYSPTVENGVSINRPLLTSTRSGDDEEGIGYRDDVVTVSAGGNVALLLMNPDASKGYDPVEDVEWLDDSNQRGVTRVYTVAGEMAALINQTPDFDGIEIGVAAGSEDDETELRFDGEKIDGVHLLDTKTGEVVDLEPGFTMMVKGSASGRFFLTRSSNVEPIIDEAIRIYKESGELVVKAPEMCGVVTVRVYDPTGRLVATEMENGMEIRVSLPAGIYIVEVKGSESGRKTAKIRL